MILFQILNIKSNEYVVLLEVFIINLIFSSSLLFLFNAPIGNDADYHIAFINYILNNGNIYFNQGYYSNYPIYHLIYVFYSLFLNITNLKIIEEILIIIQLSIFIPLYTLFKSIFNKNVSLIIYVLLLSATYIIQPRYMYYPSSFAIVYFVLFLYMIFNNKLRTSVRNIILVTIIINSIIFHPFLPILLITTYILAYFIKLQYPIKYPKFSIITLLFILGLSIIWYSKPTISNNSNFIDVIIITVQSSFKTLDINSIKQVTLSASLSYLDVLQYNLGPTLLMLFGAIGAFLLVFKYDNENAKTNDIVKILIAITTLILIPIPYVQALIIPGSLPDRWFVFDEIFLAITAGYCFYIVTQSFKKHVLINKTVVNLVIATTIFFMISSPISNQNSQIYSADLSTRTALTQIESQAAFFTQKYTNSSIYANSKYLTFINYNSTDIINPDMNTTFNSKLLLIRKIDLEDGFTIPLFGNGALLNIIPSNAYFIKYLNHTSRIYDDGQIRIYR